MKMISLILWPLIFLLFSCQPEDDMKPEIHDVTSCMENYIGPLNVLWSTSIRQDTSVANSIFPVIFKDNIIYNQLYFDRPNTLFSFDPNTGERRFVFDDFPWSPDGALIEFNNSTQQYDDQFYFNFGYYKAIFDANKQQIIWSEKFPYSGIRISGGQDHIYFIQHNEGGVIQDSEILTAHKNHPDEWISVYKKERANNENQHFGTPAEWISPENERILIFRNTRLPDMGTQHADIVAYNVSKGEIQWEIQDINESGMGTIHLPLIRDNKAYITNRNTISCIDLISGSEIWETSDLSTSFFRCAPVLTEDRIVVNGDNGIVQAVWLDSGATSWRKNDSSHNPPKMDYYKGAIYYSTNDPLGYYLYALNAETGQEIFKADSPNKDCQKNARLSWGLSIDQQSGKLYTHDGFFAMAIQLDEY